jgi:F-type H+-transporting ATPase subunit epsilon
MAELEVSIVAVDGAVWSGPAKMVVAKTVEGEIGIMAGHEPVLAILTDGVVRVEDVEGKKLSFAVHSGFFSVDANLVKVLGEAAEAADKINVERAQAALERAKAAGLDTPEEVAAYRRAEIRLEVASTAK